MLKVREQSIDPNHVKIYIKIPELHFFSTLHSCNLSVCHCSPALTTIHLPFHQIYYFNSKYSQEFLSESKVRCLWGLPSNLFWYPEADRSAYAAVWDSLFVSAPAKKTGIDAFCYWANSATKSTRSTTWYAVLQKCISPGKRRPNLTVHSCHVDPEPRNSRYPGLSSPWVYQKFGPKSWIFKVFYHTRSQ